MKKGTYRQTKLFLDLDYTPKWCYQSISVLIELIEKRVVTKLAIDIETTPVYPYNEALEPWYSKIRLFGAYNSSIGAFYADFFQEKEDIVKRLFRVMYEYDIIIIAHHAWFEGIHIYYHYGYILNYHCTLVLHRVATAGERLPADLNSACKYYGIPIEFEDNKKELQSSCFGGIISPEQTDYVISDAYKAWMIEEKGIASFPWPLSAYLFECKNLPIFIEMGVTGLPVNEELGYKILTKIEFKLKEIERSLGFNPGSRLALQRLFTQLGFIPEEREVFDFISSDINFTELDDIDKKFLGTELFNKKSEEVIQQFDDTVLLIAEKKFPRLAQWRKIRAYRRIQWNQGYIKSVLSKVHEGRVKPKILPIAQSGYRVSVNNPNLANSIKDSDLLKEYQIEPGRIIFEEPQKGMLSTDGPACHLRVLSQFCQDPFMRKAINRGDFHSQTAETICKGLSINWDFNYIKKTKDDKTDPNFFKVKQIRDGAKELIYLWLNGGQEEKAVITLATGAAKYRTTADEARKWLVGIDTAYPVATCLKSLLSEGPIRGATKRSRILRERFGLAAYEIEKKLSFIVDDNHILNALGKYTKLSNLPFNARIIAPWMSGERVWILSIAQRIFEIRKEIGYAFSSWQHDEFIGRAIDPNNAAIVANIIEDCCLDVSRDLMGFTSYYKDGDPSNPTGPDKQGRFLGDFSAIKMQIKNLTEK